MQVILAGLPGVLRGRTVRRLERPGHGIHWPYDGEPLVSAKDALGVGLGGAEVLG